MPQLKLPIDPSDVLGAVKAGADLAAAPAELLILADPEVADSVRQMLVGGESLERASEHAVASVATSVTLPPATSPETVVLVVIPAEGEAQLREGLRRASWPGGGVVAVLGDKRDSPAVTWYSDRVARVGVATAASWDRVWEALVWAAGPRAIPLARAYPTLRRAAARRLIANASLQNAAVGAVLFVPGTDLAVMTLNQLRLLLNLAGRFGYELSVDRLLELASVLGAGLGFRAVARQLMGLVPGVGWAVKGGVGYAGTKELGEAAFRYFESGAALSVHTLRERATALVQRFRR